MKAKLLSDKICPDFLYDVKSINFEEGTVILCWSTRDYNEASFALSDVELVKEEFNG